MKGKEDEFKDENNLLDENLDRFGEIFKHDDESRENSNEIENSEENIENSGIGSDDDYYGHDKKSPHDHDHEDGLINEDLIIKHLSFRQNKEMNNNLKEVNQPGKVIAYKALEINKNLNKNFTFGSNQNQNKINELRNNNLEIKPDNNKTLNKSLENNNKNEKTRNDINKSIDQNKITDQDRVNNNHNSPNFGNKSVRFQQFPQQNRPQQNHPGNPFFPRQHLPNKNINPNITNGGQTQPFYPFPYPHLYRFPQNQMPYLNIHHNQSPSNMSNSIYNSNPNLLKSNNLFHQIKDGKEKESIDILHMKINMVNLETENLALKERLVELGHSIDGSKKNLGNRPKQIFNNINTGDSGDEEVDNKRFEKKEKTEDIDIHKECRFENERNTTVISDLKKTV